MNRKRLLAMFLAFTLVMTSSGMGAFAATNLDDMPDLEFEEGVEDWFDCYIDGHTIVKDEAVAATCTTGGKTEGSHCSVCEEVIMAQKDLPMLGHQIIIVPGKEPTTTEPGWTEHSYCERCKTVFVEKEEVPVVPVDPPVTPEEPPVDPPATPENPPVNPPADSEDTPSTPEDTPVTPENPPADTPAEKHKLVKDEAVAPTCTETGLTEGLHCSLCQNVFVKQETLPALGHILVADAVVKATLKADGLSAGSHCDRCKAVVDEQKVIPKVASVKLSYTKKAYTGKKLSAPKLTVKDAEGNVLTKGTDYTVKGLVKKKAVGRYKVTVTLKGNYEGTKVKYFTIVPKKVASAKANLSRAAGATKGYNDIKFSWSKSKGAKGYLVYYKKAGASKYAFLKATTKLSVTKKNLKAGKKYTFKVIPYYKTASGKTKYYSKSQYKTASVYTLKKVTNVKVIKNGDKVKVKWKNINGENGYQISQSTKKNKTENITTFKTKKGTYKNIKATKGKTYYYKVRAYKVVNGKKVFGPWSAVKTFVQK